MPDLDNALLWLFGVPLILGMSYIVLCIGLHLRGMRAAIRRGEI